MSTSPSSSSQQQQQQQQQQHALVDRILASQDYYEVLGVNNNNNDDDVMDAAALRKAYLQTSLQIHPDKCAHERAKEAFQKTALAYQVLSDDNQRRDYNHAQRRKRNRNKQTDTNGNRSTVQEDDDDYFSETTFSYDTRAPSYQDALFVFATVVGSALGRTSGGARMVGDMAQTLYWGQQWLGKQQQEDDAATARGDTPDGLPAATSRNATTASAAMALGSSLRVASSAARLLGFRKSAVALDRAGAATQAVSAGVMVADSMGIDVQKTLLEDNRTGRTLRDTFQSSVRQTLHKSGGSSKNEQDFCSS